MATKKISELEAINTADNSDVLVVVDVSESSTRKITKGDLLKELIAKETEQDTQILEKAKITETGNKIGLEMNNDFQIVAKLYDKNNNLISTSTVIDLPLESVVVNASYDSTNKALIITLQNGNTTSVDVSDLVSGLVNETTFNTAVQNLNAGIALNSAKIEELQTRVTDLENNRSTATAEGTSIDLSDSADSEVVDIEMDGNSVQETTEGNNLFIDIPEQNTAGVSLKRNNDGTYDIVGTAVANIEFKEFENIEESGIEDEETYTLFATKQLPEGIAVRAEIYNGSTWVRGFLPSIGSSTPMVTGTANFNGANRIRYMIYVPNGTTVNIKNIGFQINKGTQELPFEKYTGRTSFTKSRLRTANKKLWG